MSKPQSSNGIVAKTLSRNACILLLGDATFHVHYQ